METINVINTLAFMGTKSQKEAAQIAADRLEAGQNAASGNLDTICKAAIELGKHGAAGADSLPNLGFILARAAMNRMDRVDTNLYDDKGNAAPTGKGSRAAIKEGSYKDAAERAYDSYLQGRSTSSHDDQNAGSRSAQISKLRTFVHAGLMQDRSIIDVLGRAKELHKGMDDAKSAYASYVDVCKAQVKVPDRDLSDDEIRDAMRKPGGKERTFEETMKALRRLVEKTHTDAPTEYKTLVEQIGADVDAVFKAANITT